MYEITLFSNKFIKLTLHSNFLICFSSNNNSLIVVNLYDLECDKSLCNNVTVTH